MEKESLDPRSSMQPEPDPEPRAVPPSFLGSVEQSARAIACVGRLQAIGWQAAATRWLLRAGRLWCREPAGVLATTFRFEHARGWEGDLFLPSPRDLVEELSRRGFEVMTSTTRLADRPLRVVVRRSDAPTHPPVEVEDQTLYLALLVALEAVVRGMPWTAGHSREPG